VANLTASEGEVKMGHDPELLELMDIFWTCEHCETQIKETTPIYSNIYGEFVKFSCYVCQYEYEIMLNAI
jgi:hypothetical protein